MLSLAVPCLGVNLLVDDILGGTYDAHKPIAIDGFDVWNTISRGDASPRTEILLNIDNQPPNGTQGLGENYQGMALRMGSMKLMMNVKNITWFKPPELGGIPLEESYSNGLITEKTDEEVLFQIKEHYMVSAISNIVSFFFNIEIIPFEHRSLYLSDTSHYQENILPQENMEYSLAII